MVYAKVSEEKTYKSWVQLELEANRLLAALDDHTHTMLVSVVEPTACNVLFFDTSKNK